MKKKTKKVKAIWIFFIGKREKDIESDLTCNMTDTYRGVECLSIFLLYSEIEILH